MDCDRARALLAGVADGELAPEDLELLEGHIAGCPPCAAEAVEILRQERALWELSGEEQAGALAARIHARLAARRAFRARRRSIWTLLAAAAALIAIGLGLSLFFREGPIGEVVRVKGAVLPGAGKVYSGGSLETPGPGSGATIRFTDGTTLDLNGGTKLSRIEKGRLALEAGTLTVETKHPIVVRTPQAEAKVMGTLFKLSVAKDATRLEVRKGEVRITKLEDGATKTVGADHFAVASRNVPFEVLPVAPPLPPPAQPPGVELAARMAPGSWLSIPGTAMRKVAVDPARYPAFSGNPGSVISGWSGAALDTKRNRLVLWGGGYRDWHGNELYAFDLLSLSWERLTDPAEKPALSQERNADGTPNGRATYNGLAYVGHADRFFAIGGAVAGNGFSVCRTPWVFDFDAKRWIARAPAASAGLGGACAYDPVTRKLWWGDESGLHAYDYDLDRWTRHARDKFYYLTAALDPGRGLLVFAGDGQVFAYDVRSPRPVRETWKSAASETLVRPPNPGFDFDPVSRRMVAWAGGPVASLDPGSKAWSATDAPGAPAPTRNGMFGRWRCVPALGVFVAVTGIDENVHFYKPGR
jgi:hypothetical protein